MADRNGPTAAANPQGNKLAMSKALGAAFLNYQVQQLEKTVNGPGSGNWRSRHQSNGSLTTNGPGGLGKGGAGRRTQQASLRKPTGESEFIGNDKGEIRRDVEYGGRTERRSIEKDDSDQEKDADVIIVDASVLVNALYQVKKWCKDGRNELLVIPLEALNTLDILKKGTTSLAQKARMASRVLEAQVGVNPRISVQQDNAFVLWDKISFSDVPAPEELKGSPSVNPSPEWVRRTVCCAKWQVENGSSNISEFQNIDEKPKIKTVLAVLSSSPQISPPLQSVKLPGPVPLPLHKEEPRSSGILVRHWATRANIVIFPVSPTAPHQGGGNNHVETEEPRAPPKRNTLPRRKNPSLSGHRGGGLVERPPAVMAMMELVAQPSKVVRVLARGEKLEPES